MPPADEKDLDLPNGWQGPNQSRGHNTAAQIGEWIDLNPYTRQLPPPEDRNPHPKLGTGSISPSDSISQVLDRRGGRPRPRPQPRPATRFQPPPPTRGHPAPPPSEASSSEHTVIPRRSHRDRIQAPPRADKSHTCGSHTRKVPALAIPQSWQARNSAGAGAVAAAAVTKPNPNPSGGSLPHEPSASPPSRAATPPAKAKPPSPSCPSPLHASAAAAAGIRTLEHDLAICTREVRRLEQENAELARVVRRLGRQTRKEEMERLRREGAERVFRDRARRMAELWGEMMGL